MNRSAQHVWLTGLLFSLLQAGYFFELQFWITAAYPSFLTVTLAWLLGSLLGLRLGRSSEDLAGTRYLLASLGAYLLCLALVRAVPYHTEMLAVHALLVAVSGVQAGHFFAVHRGYFPSASRLFFLENNGFVLGWVVAFLGLVWWGSRFHHLAPFVIAAWIYILHRLKMPQRA